MSERNKPQCRRDSAGYNVFLSGNQIGFVEQYNSRSATGRKVVRWSATNQTMSSRLAFATRADAVDWLAVEAHDDER